MISDLVKLCAVLTQHRAMHQDAQSVNCKGGLIQLIPSSLSKGLCMTLHLQHWIFFPPLQGQENTLSKSVTSSQATIKNSVVFSYGLCQPHKDSRFTVTQWLLSTLPLKASRFDLYWLLPVPTAPNYNVLHPITSHLWLFHNCTTCLQQQD